MIESEFTSPHARPGAEDRVYGLTLLQPYASAIVYGPKRTENRPWSPASLARGEPMWIVVHAGATLYEPEPPRTLGLLLHEMRDLWPDMPTSVRDFPMRAALGVMRCRVAEEYVEGDPDAWAFGPWCWRVDEVLPFPAPIPCRGYQRLWRVPPDVHAAAREAYRKAHPKEAA